MGFLIVVVLALLVITAATTLERRLGVAAPLLLVVTGIGASLLPFVPAVHVEPDWILTGVLPPLLYSASVSMPAMDFRREFTAISGLSVALVVASALILGTFFAWLIPGLGLGWGIALGAIVSPTDAVAASIVKRVGVSTRVAAVLEGEPAQRRHRPGRPPRRGRRNRSLGIAVGRAGELLLLDRRRRGHRPRGRAAEPRGAGVGGGRDR